MIPIIRFMDKIIPILGVSIESNAHSERHGSVVCFLATLLCFGPYLFVQQAQDLRSLQAATQQGLRQRALQSPTLLTIPKYLPLCNPCGNCTMHNHHQALVAWADPGARLSRLIIQERSHHCGERPSRLFWL